MTTIRMTKSPLQFPLLALLHPRMHSRRFAVLLVFGLLVGRWAMYEFGLPLWGATVIALVALLPAFVAKWRTDAQLWGRPLMVLSVLLTLQSFHTVEHVTQWMQLHVLRWSPKASAGLISAANAEIVHFAWNTGVFLTVVYLLYAGIRNPWGWLLLMWAFAHGAEHTYLFINYLERVQYLQTVGLPIAQAQGLPGILGQGGWIATAGVEQQPFSLLCTVVPSVKSASRIDVHFWWNVGEQVLLVLMAHVAMRRRVHEARHTTPHSSVGQVIPSSIA